MGRKTHCHCVPFLCLSIKFGNGLSGVAQGSALRHSDNQVGTEKPNQHVWRWDAMFQTVYSAHLKDNGHYLTIGIYSK